MRRCNKALLAALMFVGTPLAAEENVEPVSRPQLALMGTIPIYWGEAADIGEVLSGETQPHWARAVLERDHVLVPLDYLSAENLAQHRFLLLAQPRGLTAEENVALDQWVRGGGRLLLFADPMMTGESRFALGDRRRPQDIALLSPILAHWGLELRFDPEQPAGLRELDPFGTVFPVNMHGELRPLGGSDDCVIRDLGFMAHCYIGDGAVDVLADAAMLDLHNPSDLAAPTLSWLIDAIFGDGAGFVPDLPVSGRNTDATNGNPGNGSVPETGG